MAKSTTIKVKLVSSADTGFYYVTRKNSRTMTDKLVKKKYDPVARKHVEFRESKIKERAPATAQAVMPGPVPGIGVLG
jgi:large subunit ribosomal protein L33